MDFFFSYDAEGKSAGILSNMMGTYTDLLNQSLNGNSYGEELTEIAIISQCFSDTEGLTERKLFIRRENAADLRLFIDYHLLCTANRYEQYFIYKDHIIASVETLRKKVKATFRFNDLIADMQEALCIIGGVLYWKGDGWVSSERLSVGDDLWGYNERNQNKIMCNVTDVYTVKVSTFMYINIGGEILLFMPEDLVYTMEQKWKPVSSIKVGDMIQKFTDGYVKILQIKTVEMDRQYKSFRFLADHSNIFFTGYAGVLVKTCKY